MGRKYISLFTLVAFMVFCVSCHVTHTRDIDVVAKWKGKKIKIIKVVKKSGEIIKFSKKNPAYVQNEKIVGTGFDEEKRPVRISIPFNEIDVVKVWKSSALTSISMILGYIIMGAIVLYFLICYGFATVE